MIVAAELTREEQLLDPAAIAEAAPEARVVDRMMQLLGSAEGQAVYKMRKAIVEPKNVSAEWDFVATTHNLLKLFRHGYRAGEVCLA